MMEDNKPLGLSLPHYRSEQQLIANLRLSQVLFAQANPLWSAKPGGGALISVHWMDHTGICVFTGPLHKTAAAKKH